MHVYPAVPPPGLPAGSKVDAALFASATAMAVMRHKPAAYWYSSASYGFSQHATGITT